MTSIILIWTEKRKHGLFWQCRAVCQKFCYKKYFWIENNYMKWIIFWITDKNIKVYTIDSHIVIRCLKYDSFHYFNSCHFHYRVITSIVFDIDKKKKKTGAEGVRSSVTGLEYLSELKWNESFWTTDKDMCTRSSHVRYLNNPRLKYHSFHYFNSCHFHHRLRTHDGLLSSWRD